MVVDDSTPLNDTYLSGRPYYCEECGLGFAEFLACEEPYCELESIAKAQERLRNRHRKIAARLEQPGQEL